MDTTTNHRTAPISHPRHTAEAVKRNNLRALHLAILQDTATTQMYAQRCAATTGTNGPCYCPAH